MTSINEKIFGKIEELMVSQASMHTDIKNIKEDVHGLKTDMSTDHDTLTKHVAGEKATTAKWGAVSGFLGAIGALIMAVAYKVFKGGG